MAPREIGAATDQRDELARQFAVRVVERLRQAGYEAYWAGGCVRDMLLGLTPHDYDVATSARPEEVQRLFRRTVAVGASFGVVEVIGPKVDGERLKVQVATFRREGPYSDGRHPDSVTFTTAAEDAQRRDFTINGLFYDPLRGEVLDYVGGQRDLQARLLRAIGNPYERFEEDKLRMLRAVRLAAQFQLTIETTTATAIRQLAEQIRVVSAERIAEELRRLLVHPRRRQGLELLHELHLLPAVLPEVSAMPHFDVPTELPTDHGMQSQSPHSAASVTALERNSAVGALWQHTLRVLELLREPTFPLALAALFHDAGIMHVPPQRDHASADADASATVVTHRRLSESVRYPDHEKVGARLVEQAGRRLRLSNAEWQRAAWLVAHHHALDAPWDLPAHRLKPLLAQVAIGELLALVEADASADGRSLAHVQFCRDKLRTWPPQVLNPPPLITGDDLIALGLKPGPAFGRILQRIRDAQLDEILQTREQALALAQQLVQETKTTS
ncbi:MAG: HD domain-containing protein [Gemmatales bacterium]|nr:HD domain-containing protein [Gemmatales bacterium]MDW8223994.1 HD domain-containing protein [Gemmatales bacterium]